MVLFSMCVHGCVYNIIIFCFYICFLTKQYILKNFPVSIHRYSVFFYSFIILKLFDITFPIRNFPIDVFKNF